MTAATLCGEDSSLASQCLALCQTLVSQGKAFTFSLKFDSNSKLDTKEGKASAVSPEALTRKKVSPSTKRRNSRRRAEFLRKKQSSLLAASSPASHPASGVASVPAGYSWPHPSLHISFFWETPGGFMCGQAGGANLLKSRWCSAFSFSLFTFSITIWGMAANKG